MTLYSVYIISRSSLIQFLLLDLTIGAITGRNEYQDYETNLGTIFAIKIENLKSSAQERETLIAANQQKLNQIINKSAISTQELKTEIQNINLELENFRRLIDGLLVSVESTKQEIHLFTEKNYSGIRYSLDTTVVNLCINFGNAYIQDNSKSILTHRCIMLYDHANCVGDYGMYEHPTLDFGILNKRFTSYKLC